MGSRKLAHDTLLKGYQLAFYIILNGIYSDMLLDFNIKNCDPWSNKKHRASAAPAILNSMPLLDASPAKCPDNICFEFKHCVQLI
jgi:hypothetical protein